MVAVAPPTDYVALNELHKAIPGHLFVHWGMFSREAQRLVHARNEAQHTPQVNLMIAKAYLAASDPTMTTRIWQDVLNAIIGSKVGDTRHRWETAAKDHAFDALRKLPLVKTQAEDGVTIGHYFRIVASGSFASFIAGFRPRTFLSLISKVESKLEVGKDE